MTITSEDLELIRKFQDILERGYYVDGKQLTDCYNRVLGKHVNSTNCSSCLRARTKELVEAANRFERMIALEKQQETPVVEEPKEIKKPKTRKK